MVISVLESMAQGINFFLFTLPSSGNVTVEIFTVGGVLADEIDAGVFSAGTNIITYSAKNLNSGLYFARLTSGMNSGVIKMV